MLLWIVFVFFYGVCGQKYSPIARLRSVPGSIGQVSYTALINVRVGGKSSSPLQTRSFVLDTRAQFPILSKCKSSRVTKTVQLQVDRLQNGFFPGGLANFPVAVSCTREKNKTDVAALGSGDSSLQSQISKLTAQPASFAYCLTSFGFGQLSFGRETYTLFQNGDVLKSRPLSFKRTSLAVDNNPRSGVTTYLLQLKKISFNSASIQVKEVIQIGTASRFTVLPNAAYDFVRQQVEREATKRKLSREPSRVGPLSLCYKTKGLQLSKFPAVDMELSGKAVWKITPSNYLLSPKPDVFCFGFLKAGTGPSVIGTLQQEEVYVEYNEPNKTLRFTEPLLVKYQLGCNNTIGT